MASLQSYSCDMNSHTTYSWCNLYLDIDKDGASFILLWIFPSKSTIIILGNGIIIYVLAEECNGARQPDYGLLLRVSQPVNWLLVLRIVMRVNRCSVEPASEPIRHGHLHRRESVVCITAHEDPLDDFNALHSSCHSLRTLRPDLAFPSIW